MDIQLELHRDRPWPLHTNHLELRPMKHYKDVKNEKQRKKAQRDLRDKRKNRNTYYGD